MENEGNVARLPPPGKQRAVPPGKKVLNVHVSTYEHERLREFAQGDADTITNIVRGLIRKEIDRRDGSKRR